MPAFSASLFKNDRKDSDRQPDFTGPGSISKEDFMAIADAVTGGKMQLNERGEIKLRVAGWRRESSAGKPYISIQLQVDDYKPAAPTAGAAKPSLEEDLF